MQVAQHDVRGKPADEWQRLLPALRLADHFDVDFGREDHPHPGPHQRMVINNHDTNGHPFPLV